MRELTNVISRVDLQYCNDRESSTLSTVSGKYVLSVGMLQAQPESNIQDAIMRSKVANLAF